MGSGERRRNKVKQRENAEACLKPGHSSNRSDGSTSRSRKSSLASEKPKRIRRSPSGHSQNAVVELNGRRIFREVFPSRGATPILLRHETVPHEWELIVAESSIITSDEGTRHGSRECEASESACSALNPLLHRFRHDDIGTEHRHGTPKKSEIESEGKTKMRTETVGGNARIFALSN